jgi:hypothetical protein
MNYYFSDLHVELLSKAVLQPGEQLLGKTVTLYNPWWALGLIRRPYLLLATTHRLVLIEHNFTFLHAAVKLTAVESIPWQQLQELRLKGLINKKIRLRGQTERGPKALKMRVPNALFGLLAPMRGNMNGARAVVSVYQSMQPALSGQPMASPLPGASRDVPRLNAPGYASQPPAAPPASFPPQPPGYSRNWPHP